MNKGKVLSFHFIRAGTKTPGGLIAQPSLTRYYKSDQFRNNMSDPHNQLTSQIESILCPEIFQSMYTQMLAGLYERLRVLRVGAVYATVLPHVFRFLRLRYPGPCQDIRTGTLSPKITDPSLIRVMYEIMRPDPDLARTIEKECSKENWEGIIKRVWPNTKYLEVVVTGSMAQYIPMLDYYSGGLPKLSMEYRLSKGSFGINLRPMAKPSEVSYTIMPNMAYFEFIPLGSTTSAGSSDTTSLVDLAKVEVGKEYELVVTTHAGLYRYCFGDVLLVTGFHNAAPQFRCILRQNVLLSIDADKTDEADLQRAIDNAPAFLRRYSNATIFEYTTYADANAFPGHCVVYLELMQTNEPDNKLLAKCCLEMEESLNTVYRECRNDGSLGPLEIRVVGLGTFEKLMDYVVSKGASTGQYKTPRCANSFPMVKSLDSRVVSDHFSPSMPRWSPTVGGGRAVVGNK